MMRCIWLVGRAVQWHRWHVKGKADETVGGGGVDCDGRMRRSRIAGFARVRHQLCRRRGGTAVATWNDSKANVVFAQSTVGNQLTFVARAFGSGNSRGHTSHQS